MKKIKILKSTDKKYPSKLLKIKDYPKELYVLGNEKLLNKKSIAIVGSRDCTEYGAKYAESFAEQISKENICIVSGMALGIDSFAHIGALKEKGNTIRTRNQRLAAIKSFYQYCLYYETNNIHNINQILTIKFKKYTKKVMDYLTEEELQTIFNSIDSSTKKGLRNLTLLVLLYDTGARASEIINLKVEDIRLEEKVVILTGKGNKQRVVPIMENTKELIDQYLNQEKINNGLIFKKNATYSLIHHLFIKLNNQKNINKNITPHTFRRSRAIHLLDKGVNIMYIKELLDHESVTTTEEYAKVLEKSKFEAIKKANPEIKTEYKEDWNNDQDLLNQLLNL